jgi:hypothetical protein
MLALLACALGPWPRVAAHMSFQALVPNGDRVTYYGAPVPGVGHANVCGRGPLNAFGADFGAAGRRWTPALCQKDSDGDGRTNGEELGDPTCVWTVGQPPTQATGITHPGEPDYPPGTLMANLGAYPGYSGLLEPTGMVVIRPAARGIVIAGFVTGVEPAVQAGWHVHVGTSCDDEGEVGGHLIPEPPTDPWTAITFLSDAAGAAVLALPIPFLPYAAAVGHALVIHASDGTRVGCGLLQTADVLVVPVAPLGTGTAAGVLFLQTTANAVQATGLLRGLEPNISSSWYVRGAMACNTAAPGSPLGGSPAPWPLVAPDTGTVALPTTPLVWPKAELLGRTVVVVGADGSPIGCGAIPGKMRMGCSGAPKAPPSAGGPAEGHSTGGKGEGGEGEGHGPPAAPGRSFNGDLLIILIVFVVLGIVATYACIARARGRKRAAANDGALGPDPIADGHSRAPMERL